ncbi:DegT/DnrJ/EryC1/StrS aminotransferase family protein [Planomicrobium sp. YIM 101495]|uniref:DegT/DnrJ/EryC1/StrS family aminotransferase n=1 Tax=Planomicrobium sp. YIM 101495 TaxID=2665160 RepID=UPI0012B71B62|nr:DegT/DnrJ/EryC1/StrS family aminotransferase [Planomicrobium sp. YIM 101495]MTD30775.1 aminotransferase class I/II-fold pyridoxal phosphate-dependent enzyme [Planomicrobium sp. YIM 101495]
MTDKFIPYCLPDITEREIKEVIETLESGWLAKGPKTIEFEEKFAKYVGAKYAVAMNSCTAALHIALIAGGVKPGDEVITTSMTFAASVNTILHVGATPVFVDIDPETGLIDIDKIEEKITEKTKAIVPVHYAGQACDLDRLYEIANKHNLFVSEDAAHAIYTEYKGKRIGYNPQGAVSYSFYATKNLATGEGGMLVTDSKEIADRARVLITHGMSKNAWNRYGKGGSWMYDIEEPGYKYNMFDIQAALGITQLDRLEEMQEARENLVKLYLEGLAGIKGIEVQKVNDYTSKNAWHLFIIRVTEEFPLKRDELIEYLAENNIGTSVHFIPVHLMSAYKEYKEQSELVNTEMWFNQILSLPLYSTLEEADVKTIIEKIKSVPTTKKLV